MPLTAEEAGVPNVAAAYLKSLEDPEVIERVRCSINDAHVFKLPHRPTSGGWRGADWDTEVWQGTLKVVERGDLTVILLLNNNNNNNNNNATSNGDRNNNGGNNSNNIFAVCPVQDGAVDRCVDSSRYFVLRVENAQNGRHMYIGMAFNERNDAFDFNTSLEDSRREKEMEANPIVVEQGPAKDYSMKEGDKIHINVNKVAGKRGGSAASRRTKSATAGKKGGVGLFLKGNPRDTKPRRTESGTAVFSGPNEFNS